MDGEGSGTIAPLGHGDPRTLGGWELTGRLGAGGMGIVYLATSGDRLAAVKAASPGLAGHEEFRARFRREVTICRRVDGPQTAELLDADTEGPQPWLAVRYVPGPTLDQAISRHGPMGGTTLHGFALAVLEGLRSIHTAGVIHRDLKPANIILTPETPVIIDFGIAGATDVTSLTAAGTAMGSAGWMAPEQVLGHEVTPAADVFCWAAIVAFAATGRPPFGGGRPEALTYRIVHSTADLDGVPERLRPTLERALATDPDDRPSVEDLLQDLASDPSTAGVAEAIGDQWVGAEASALSATRIWPAELPVKDRPRRRRRRGRKVTLVAAALIAVAALAGGAIARSQGSDDGSEAAATTTTQPRRITTTSTSTSISTTTTSSNSTSTSQETSSTIPPTTEPTASSTSDAPAASIPVVSPEEAKSDAQKHHGMGPIRETIGFMFPDTLSAISGEIPDESGGHVYRVLFYRNGKYIGADDATGTSYGVHLVSAIGDSVVVGYDMYGPESQPNQPTRGTEERTFRWNGSGVTPDAALPPRLRLGPGGTPENVGR